MSQDKLKYLCSTIGRKQIMALAGIGLCGFVLLHASGNMLLFKGPEAYNSYSHALVTNPLIYIAEAGLALLFILHIVIGLALTARNTGARPEKYALAAGGAKKTSIVTKTMAPQGIVILIYVVHHLITFKFGTVYDVEYSGVHMRDLFRLAHEIFQSPFYVTWYVFAVVVLTIHLSHGVYSALQTLGVQHPKYTPATRVLAVAYGVFIGAMFASQPLYMMFFYRG